MVDFSENIDFRAEYDRLVWVSGGRSARFPPPSISPYRISTAGSTSVGNITLGAEVKGE